jgi:hypothetical protein
MPGTVVLTETFRDITDQFYWFETPEGWTRADGVPDDVEIFGPFSGEAEANESQRLVLLGPQCEVIEGARGIIH